MSVDLKDNKQATKKERIIALLDEESGCPGVTNAEIAHEVGCDEGSVRRARAEWERSKEPPVPRPPLPPLPAVIPDRRLPVAKIEPDFRYELRVGLVPEAVEEYAELFLEGHEPPPVDVFTTAGEDGGEGEYFVLVHGFHRHRAAVVAGVESLPCIVHTGDERDALRVALAANGRNPLQRTQADKRKAILAALADEEFGKLSSRDLAALCFVSHWLVQEVRRELEEADEARYAVERVGAPEGGTDDWSDPAPPVEELPGKSAGHPSIPDATDPDESDDVDDSMGANPEESEVPGMLVDELNAFMDGLPLTAKLKGSCAVRFQSDVVKYLTLTRGEEFGSFHSFARRVFSPKGARLTGPYHAQVARFLALPHPRDWAYCVNCRGSGTAESKECSMCRGHGYQVLAGSSKP